jgi:hypothetical protein
MAYFPLFGILLSQIMCAPHYLCRIFHHFVFCNFFFNISFCQYFILKYLKVSPVHFTIITFYLSLPPVFRPVFIATYLSKSPSYPSVAIRNKVTKPSTYIHCYLKLAVFYCYYTFVYIDINPKPFLMLIHAFMSSACTTELGNPPSCRLSLSSSHTLPCLKIQGIKH